MKPEIVYTVMKRKYLANPTLENAMAFMGTLVYRFPILHQAPLSRIEIERLAQEAGVEIWTFPLQNIPALAVHIKDPENLPRLARRDGKAPITDREPTLLSDEMVRKVSEHLKRGGGPVILIRPKLPEGEHCFFLAHELGHILYGHTDQGLAISRGPAELHANLFARWVSGLPHPRYTPRANLVLEALVTGDKALLRKAARILGNCKAVIRAAQAFINWQEGQGHA